MSQSYYEFFNPVKIISGYQALEHIPHELASLRVSRPLLITDEGVVQARLLEPVKQALYVGGVALADIFHDVPPDSSTITVTTIAQCYRKNDADSMIAIGGGSVIDTAKAVNILASMGGDDLLAYRGSGILTQQLKPLFVLPTTAGTGSEVTKIAVIHDEVSGRKIPYASAFLMPDVAVLDPRMTMTLPASITAATAMDAMTHAIEAFLGTAKNPLSDAYAVAAIRGIKENLSRVLDNPADSNARLKLAEAAAMAGIAFSNSMVGLVHAIGHSMGAICHLSHGVCMNLMLPYVLRYNLPRCEAAMAELLLPLAGADVYSQTSPTQRPARAIAAICAMRDELFERTGLPRTLSESKQVRQSELVDIARMSLDDGALLYNRVDADYGQVLGLLREAW